MKKYLKTLATEKIFKSKTCNFSIFVGDFGNSQIFVNVNARTSFSKGHLLWDFFLNFFLNWVEICGKLVGNLLKICWRLFGNIF